MGEARSNGGSSEQCADGNLGPGFELVELLEDFVDRLEAGVEDVGLARGDAWLGDVAEVDDAEVDAADGGFIVVAHVGAQTFGIVVDGVFHTEEIVVKPMSSLLRHVGMFSGNTILGDGSVIMIIDPNALGTVVGSVEGQAELASATPAAEATVEDKTALLLFRAGSRAMKAVPLSLITRLEEIERDSIEHCNGEDVVQYRGALMPLVYMHDETRGGAASVQPVLVFTEGGKPVGLAIDQIVDIVEERLEIELKTDTPGVIGAAIVIYTLVTGHKI
jgi:two-component system chemotaxis sensor kinase CheA